MQILRLQFQIMIMKVRRTEDKNELYITNNNIQYTYINGGIKMKCGWVDF